MALVVETGSGSATAESYCSVSAADARHQGLGNTDWAALSTASKEQALRRATVYMTQAFRGRWKGNRCTSTQALDWPRFGVCVDGFDYPSTTLPADIVNACADLALKASAEELAPDQERAVIREKIGPLETEYSSYSPQAKQFRAVDMLLSSLLKGSSAMAMLVRT